MESLQSQKQVSQEKKKKGSFKALIPLISFVAIYLMAGMILNLKGVEMAFYQFPAPIAAFFGIVIGLVILSGSFEDKVKVFLKGCGSEDIVIMCMIYLLAGAFSTISSAMGGVDATVNLGLSLIPIKFIVVGLFVIASFIALATGTSVGTVVAIAPIAISLAGKAGLNLPLTLGALVGGAMLGDNLSIISDTTIAATRTQGVSMKDKFRANFRVVMPAALVTIGLLLVLGRPETLAQAGVYEYSIIKILPYIFVLAAALLGVHVFIVLTGGIALSGLIGMATGSFGFLGLVQTTYEGFTGMTEIFILSLLTGGLAHLVSEYGGLTWILNQIKTKIKDQKSAEIGIGGLAALTNFATANNTVSILISGELAREVAKEYDVDPKTTASLLDIFACTVQSIIPYGAQLLIAAGFTNGLVSPVEIVPYVWYSYLLMVSVGVTILFKKRG